MKWEYMVVYYENVPNESIITTGEKSYFIQGRASLLAKKLDEFGQQGWEASSVSRSGGSSDLLLFKRPL